MKRILLLVFIITLGFSTNPVFADTINMINGTVLKGKLVRITSGLINMKTKEGYRKYNRNMVLNNRDFIEVGFMRKKIITGKIFFLTKYIVEMQTPEGLLKIHRFKVRNIVLGHVHIPEEQLQIQLPEQVEKNQKNLK